MLSTLIQIQPAEEVPLIMLVVKAVIVVVASAMVLTGHIIACILYNNKPVNLYQYVINRPLLQIHRFYFYFNFIS